MLPDFELTPPERRIWDAFAEGRRVDLRTGEAEGDDPARGGEWGPERTVRAAVLVALLLGGNAEPSGAVASLRLVGARITGRLDLDGAEIGHVLSLEHCWLEEAVSLFGASTRTIRIRDSWVPGVEAGLARIQGRLDLKRSVMEGGRLALVNAHVAGELNLIGVRISVPEDWAVFAGGLVMEGGVFCRDFTTRGGVRLLGAQLPGGLFMRGARLSSPDGVALAADSVTATTLDLSSGFTAEGTVRLRGARISDNLSFAGAILKGARGGDGPSVLGLQMQATDFDFTVAERPSGAVDLRGAQVSFLHDSERSWPDVVELEGFVYGSIETVEARQRPEAVGRRESVARRVDWVRRTPGYSPQPYEQLASWYRKVGHDDDARRVLLAKQRHRRRTLSPAGRAWGQVLDATVGYGYRPWLAGVWLLAMILLGTLVFEAHDPTPVKQGEGAPFQPLVYTLDLLIPIGGLGQRTNWYWTDSGPQWLAYALIATGWVLTTAVVAGVSRTLNKS
ncbi:oxidoreductase [Streptomyces sp. NPDC058256]|uniref:oxidoreductase n=1 Tax=Streptomyces sp. NPDC058256 TaxID=3346408 RepID=UPI0036E4B55E